MNTRRGFSLFLLLVIGIAAYGQVRPADSSPQGPALPDTVFHRSPADLPSLPPLVTTVRSPHGAQKVDLKYDLTRIGDRNVGGGLDFYSLDREIAMGRELAQQIEASSRVVRDPAINEYINRIGQSLVANSDARVPFEIKVLEDDEVNAFALPGGFFFVNTGLIEAADNEAGLAGVMAHEIAHVAARHATKNATRNQIMNMASIPLMMFGGPAVFAVREVMGFAVPMGVLKFSRDAEREADLLGIEYDYETGYDPQEFVRLFEKFKSEEKGKHSFISKAFSTHPMTEDRIKRAQEEIQDHLPPRPDYVVDTSEFQQIKARVVALDNKNKVDEANIGRPVLIQRTNEGTPDKTSGNDDSDRPTLHRK